MEKKIKVRSIKGPTPLAVFAVTAATLLWSVSHRRMRSIHRTAQTAYKDGPLWIVKCYAVQYLERARSEAIDSDLGEGRPLEEWLSLP